MVFWDSVFQEIASEYPDVETDSLLVDAAAMMLVRNPKRFEIVVAPNLFGDILTDLAAGVSNGMGLAASANLNPEKKFPSMFEPVHGSAPDIAGQGKANPLASIWSAALMLEFLGEKKWADAVVQIIHDVVNEKKVLTPDMGGTASTSDVGDEVVRKLIQYK